MKKAGLPFLSTGIKDKIIKKTIMKNSFKLGALALVISLSVAACGGNKSTSTSDTTKVTTVDSTKSTVVDTTKKDTAATTTTTTVKKDSTKKM